MAIDKLGWDIFFFSFNLSSAVGFLFNKTLYLNWKIFLQNLFQNLHSVLNFLLDLEDFSPCCWKYMIYLFELYENFFQIFEFFQCIFKLNRLLKFIRINSVKSYLFTGQLYKSKLIPV
jgi:hypothetical protein